MIPKWTPELAGRVAKHLEAILTRPPSSADVMGQAARRTNGLPVYGDLGGVIALTPGGELISYSEETDTITPVQEGLWQDVALAYLGRRYPDLRELLPERPAQASACPSCSGSGWMMDGRLFCRLCRGLGWIE
jgi:hypothetical protein